MTTARPGRVGLLSAGALGSALAASICCLGPLILAALGLGGGALLLKFAPYRPYFLGATVALLGSAFYLNHRAPSQAECGPDGECTTVTSSRVQRIMLWIVALIVMLAAASPYLIEALF